MNIFDIEDSPVNALASITIMLNKIKSKAPDHEFIPMLETVEATLRKMREHNQKINAENLLLGRTLAKMGFDDVTERFEKEIE